ncbi:MAG: ImuA family protein [Planctomycetota bacterium]
MVTIHPEGSGAAGLAGRAASTLPASLLRSGLVSAGDLRGREEARETIRSGFTAIDALLPGGGLRRGSLVEWLAGGGATPDGAGGGTAASGAVAGDHAAADVTSGAGAVSLAVAVACRLAAASTGPKTIVVVDRGGWFHPPAVLPWLDDSRQLVVARPSHDDDEIWAIDQALRCRGVAAVVAWPRGVAGRSAWGGREPMRAGGGRGGSKPGSQWTVAMRRWQLAARASGAVGLLVRLAAAAREPSWAEARLAVSPLPGGTLLERRLELVKVGGSWSGGLEGRAMETVLDLARGCEGRLSREPARGFGPPRRQPAADWSIDLQAGGLSCRAS